MAATIRQNVSLTYDAGVQKLRVIVNAKIQEYKVTIADMFALDVNTVKVVIVDAHGTDVVCNEWDPDSMNYIIRGQPRSSTAPAASIQALQADGLMIRQSLELLHRRIESLDKNKIGAADGVDAVGRTMIEVCETCCKMIGLDELLWHCEIRLNATNAGLKTRVMDHIHHKHNATTTDMVTGFVKRVEHQTVVHIEAVGPAMKKILEWLRDVGWKGCEVSTSVCKRIKCKAYTGGFKFKPSAPEARAGGSSEQIPASASDGMTPSSLSSIHSR
mmetsp:Transcript_11784/g.26687  ORF Transcript_11784/g.26687 Transcript_11784/m.26687 type:complete len:273 (-) Transcript_11784:29-847(-)